MFGYENRKRFLVNIAFIAVALLLAFIFFKFLSGYLMPLVIGIIIAAMLQRPIKFLSKKTHIPKALWAVFLVLISFSALMALVGFLMFQLYQQVQNFVSVIPSYLPYFSEFFSNTGNSLLPFLEGVPDEIITAINSMPEKIVSSLTSVLTSWGSNFATGFVSAAPSTVITFVVTIIATCYIAKDYGIIRAFIVKQIPQRFAALIGDIKSLFSSNLLKVGKGYLILMGITFVELCIGLLILRVNYAIPLAALIAVVDILPVLGVGTVLLPWALLKLISGDYVAAIGFVVIYLIITLLRSFLEPKVISHQIGIPPLVTLLAIYAGFKLFGFYGMIGFPLIIIIITALQENGKIKVWNPLSADEVKKAK